MVVEGRLQLAMPREEDWRQIDAWNGSVGQRRTGGLVAITGRCDPFDDTCW